MPKLKSLFLSLLFLISIPYIQAQEKSRIDFSFNHWKRLTGGANGAIPTPDGKALLYGYFEYYDTLSLESRIVKINIDGTLDQSFKNYKQLNGGFSIDYAAIAPDGKIILVVKGYDSLLISRILPNGSPDKSFNSLLKYGEGYNVKLLVQQDNKILVKEYFRETSGYKFKVFRLNEDGSEDHDFKTIKIKSFGPYELTSQKDGKFLSQGF